LGQFSSTRLRGIACVLIAIITLTGSPPSFSTQSDPLFDPSYLNGVDTIHVESGYDGPVLPRIPLTTHPSGQNVFVRSVRNIFASRPEVNIITTLSAQDAKRNSVLMLSFSVSTRVDEIEGKPVSVGALSLELWRRSEELPGPTKPISVASYPFVITDNADQMERTLEAGIHLLADHLPSYYACGNHIGSDPCSYSSLALPYGRQKTSKKGPPNSQQFKR